MKTIHLLLAMILVLCLSVQAQQEKNPKSGTPQNQTQEIEYVPVSEEILIDDFYSSGGGYMECFYYGDPSGMYLDENWQEGEALLLDGSEMKGNFRYNIYKQKMEAISEEDTFAFAKPCELEYISIGDSRFIYATFIRPEGEVSNTWFEVLCEGECTLLLRRYIKFRVTDGDDDPSDDQLYRLEAYYTKKGDGELERLLVSKKELLEIMNDHESQISSYIKQNKIKVKEREDLMRLFAYYNSLE